MYLHDIFPDDDGKEITNIHYNFLNVPLKIEANIGTITNTYSAEGVKLRSENTVSGQNKDFHDGIEYLDNELEAIYHEQGRIAYYDETVVTSEGDAYDCLQAYNEFCLKDHLGNPRIRFADKNEDGRLEHNLQDSCKNEIFGTNHYYPFDMETEGHWYLQRTGVKNHYRYNGKEDLGAVGFLDYGFRHYDPEIGRFLSVDPIAETYPAHSPYNYAHNNPVRYIDFMGLGPDDIIVEGDSEFRKTVVYELQRLTNDKIELQDGKVVIVEEGGANGGQSLSEGTQLVRDLVNSENTTTIETSPDDGNHTKRGDREGSENGVGTDATVQYAQDNTGSDVVNVDGSTGRPTRIGLAHELMHADNVTSGTADNRPVIVNDPDNGHMRVPSRMEEVNTRQRENVVRTEQGVIHRASMRNPRLLTKKK